MKINEKAAQEATIAIKVALNDRLFKNGIITKTMYEYAKAQLLRQPLL